MGFIMVVNVLVVIFTLKSSKITHRRLSNHSYQIKLSIIKKNIKVSFIESIPLNARRVIDIHSFTITNVSTIYESLERKNLTESIHQDSLNLLPQSKSGSKFRSLDYVIELASVE
jgi:hypothetical protein